MSSPLIISMPTTSDLYGLMYGKGLGVQRRTSFYGRSLIGRNLDID